MNPVQNFISQFKASVILDESLIIKKQNRYFLLNEDLKRQVRKDFFYAGAYLGKIKDAIFFPSFILLAMIGKEKANKIMVDEKTAWLFICGRDVFKRGILKVMGSKRKGDYTLIVNEHDECLGFGKILRNMNKVKDENKVIVKNISDIGDFLRREK